VGFSNIGHFHVVFALVREINDFIPTRLAKMRLEDAILGFLVDLQSSTSDVNGAKVTGIPIL
jgi:hypothetical protein